MEQNHGINCYAKQVSYMASNRMMKRVLRAKSSISDDTKEVIDVESLACRRKSLQTISKINKIQLCRSHRTQVNNVTLIKELKEDDIFSSIQTKILLEI